MRVRVRKRAGSIVTIRSSPEAGKWLLLEDAIEGRNKPLWKQRTKGERLLFKAIYDSETWGRDPMFVGPIKETADGLVVLFGSIHAFPEIVVPVVATREFDVAGHDPKALESALSRNIMWSDSPIMRSAFKGDFRMLASRFRLMERLLERLLHKSPKRLV